MDHFAYRDGIMHAENVSCITLAETIGTPCYVYTTATLRRHYQVLDASIQGLSRHRICYALKACPNLAVIQTLARMGAGADCVSEGELRRAAMAGIAPEHMVFSGVGKTHEEMRYAISLGIGQANVESEPELHQWSMVAQSMGAQIPIALRVNPDIAPKTHAKISTGKKETKFGVHWESASELYETARQLPGLVIQGISMHIGSQITELEPFAHACARIVSLTQHLRAQGHSITTIDIGGGLGIPYHPEDQTTLPSEYGAMLTAALAPLDVTVLLEPGRLLVGNAGILLTRVLYIKTTPHRRFVIIDAGMNDLLRPSHYNAYHAILPVHAPHPTAEYRTVDIVGPVCETGDYMALERPMPPLQAGELLAIRSAGAYGASMSGTYNSRLLVPEVLIDGTQIHRARLRPTYEAMFASEVLLP